MLMEFLNIFLRRKFPRTIRMRVVQLLTKLPPASAGCSPCNHSLLTASNFDGFRDRRRPRLVSQRLNWFSFVVQQARHVQQASFWEIEFLPRTTFGAPADGYYSSWRAYLAVKRWTDRAEVFKSSSRIDTRDISIMGLQY